jgi:hypothetical protein
MTDPKSTAYSLVPWVRRGLASRVSGPPTKNYAELAVTLSVNNAAVTTPPMPQIRLLGPGDITSMDASAVIRTDPRDGADAFEPNYLAMVELAQPDLPWWFTPAAPDGAKLRPWICLLVVAEADGVALAVRRDGPSVLALTDPFDPRAQLPDLTHADAWAHAQVTGDSGDALKAALDGDASARLGRLVSPRKLEPDTNYIACIVPTYRAGVKAGLGLAVDENDLAPAWDANTAAPLSLPVYYSFRFRTGDGGDFASLARRITPPATQLDAGKRPVDVSTPGFGAAPAPGISLDFEGALRTVGVGPSDWPAGAQAPYETQLRNALTPPTTPTGDPVVTPPVYGRTQSGSDLPKDHGAPVWLGDLNLDPRMRAAAGAGAQVVQRDQEAMAASAWDQLGEIRKANQLLRQAQLARGVSESIQRRHLDAVATDGAYLQITAPVHSRVRITIAGIPLTLRGHVQASVLPVRAVSGPMRKMARPRGPLGRQMTAAAKPQLVERLNRQASAGATALTAAGPLQLPRGMVALDDVSPDIQVAKMSSRIPATVSWVTKEVVVGPVVNTTHTTLATPTAPPGERAAPIHPTDPTDIPQTIPGDDTPRTLPGDNVPVGTTKLQVIDWNTDPDVPALFKGTRTNLPAQFVFPSDTAALAQVAQGFRSAANSINQYLNTAPAPLPDPPPLGGTAGLATARTALRARLDAKLTIAARFRARIPLDAGPDPLQPLIAGPQFPQPMYAALADLSPAWMLPGIDKMPMNAATLVQTNPRFVEAFMVGLNDSLVRELLWREFPLGLTATYFRNFWGGANPDIPTIDSFDRNGHLGDDTADHASGGNLVLLIRADLFRRYPNTVVSAMKATWNDATKLRGIDSSTRKWPLFRGTIGTDLNFFGFNVPDPRGPDTPTVTNAGWYFVLEEHVTEPRFGLEPEKNPLPDSVWNDLSWPEVTLDRGHFLDPTSNQAAPPGEPKVAWGTDSAAMAYILMRRPVRVAMHGRALLPEGNA